MKKRPSLTQLLIGRGGSEDEGEDGERAEITPLRSEVKGGRQIWLARKKISEVAQVSLV
jgi:hypothetical protein